MAQVTLYSTRWCWYCRAAKALLQRKGVAYEEIDLTNDTAGRAALVEKANGQRTVPQIFIGARHVGGFSDMQALDERGELDPLLGS